jgi:hypothetical protein
MIDFADMAMHTQIKTLYEEGEFIMSIRYYKHKVNLYLLGSELFEVFINHKLAQIETIQPLDRKHTRMKFYTDQISIPVS